MMKIDQSALPHPDRSGLRKMSAKIAKSNQTQMTKSVNQSIDQNTCPVPNSARTIVLPPGVADHRGILASTLAADRVGGRHPPAGGRSQPEKLGLGRRELVVGEHALVPQGGEPFQLGRHVGAGRRRCCRRCRRGGRGCWAYACCCSAYSCSCHRAAWRREAVRHRGRRPGDHRRAPFHE